MLYYVLKRAHFLYSVGIQQGQRTLGFLGNWICFHSRISTFPRSCSPIPSAPGFVPVLCFLIVYSVRFLANGSLQSSVPFIYLLLRLLLLLLLAVHGRGRPCLWSLGRSCVGGDFCSHPKRQNPRGGKMNILN